MAAKHDKQIVTRLFQLFPDVVDRGSVDLLDEVMAPDVKVHGTTGQFADLGSFKESVRLQAQSMDQTTVEVLNLVAEKDTVSAVFTHSLTFTSDFQGMPAAGKQVKISGTAHFRTHAGKVVEVWIHEDIPAMTAQIAG